MAQALLNNLNINAEQFTPDKQGVDKVALADFAQILQGKTESNSQAETNKETDVDNKDLILDIKTLGDLKENKINTENLSTIMDEAVQEAVIEIVVDNTLIQDEVENTEETTDEQTSENDTENDTITEEDPTMNKEIIYHQTLENPTAAMVLQSQLQKNFSKGEEQNEEESQNNEQNLQNSKTVNSSAKNFENNLLQRAEKEAVLLSASDKSNTAQKSEGSKLSDLVEERIVEDLNIEVVETQDSSSEGGSSDFMNNQSPQEQAVKAMIHHEGTNSKIEVISTVQTQKAPTEVSANKIIEQIAKQMEGMYNGSKVNIVLNPGTLGKVSLQILNSKDGLSAQFTVNTPEARDLLMKGLDGLRESLLAQGVSVDNVTVKLSETEDGKSPFDWTEQEGSRGGNKQQGSRKQKEGEKQFEQTMFDINNKEQ